MQKSRIFPIILALLLAFSVFPPGKTAHAQASILIVDQPPDIIFPESITFSAEIRGDATFESVVLEYGVDQLTCGTVIAYAFPEVEPGNGRATAAWTWEMRQSGTLPPGAQVWWRWKVITREGKEVVSEQKTITWLDDVHNWRNIEDSGVTLHWYEGSRSFAQTLHTAAIEAIKKLNTEAGLAASGQVHIYIYGSTSDMREAILYEPGWTGGVAFPEHNIVLIGVSQDDLEWGKSTVAHELTHVLAGRSTFSCLQSIPTWIVEGLAMYSEGELDAASQAQLDDAIRNDKLIPLRALSGGFSEEAEKADLSYSQSYSVVNFLLENQGREKMQQLLESLRNAETIDNALVSIYGYNVDGLEKVWRQAIGARQRAEGGEPTPTPAPTIVPTIRPVSASSMSAATPTARPESVPMPTATAFPSQQMTQEDKGFSLAPILVGLCIVFLLILVGLGFFIANRLTKKQEAGDENQ